MKTFGWDHEALTTVRVQHVDAQAIGERLAHIEARTTLTPTAVLTDARWQHSPLHPLFEWDDTAAADAYRLDQARQIVRAVRVIRETDDADAPITVTTVTTRQPSSVAQPSSFASVSARPVHIDRPRSEPIARDTVFDVQLPNGLPLRYATATACVDASQELFRQARLALDHAKWLRLIAQALGTAAGVVGERFTIEEVEALRVKAAERDRARSDDKTAAA